MKYLWLLIALAAGLACPAQDSLPDIQPYLPERVGAFPQVRDLAISPAGNECFFTVQSHMGDLSALVFLRKEKKKWSEPVIASFSGQYMDLEPFFTADGLQLWFASNRPRNGDTAPAPDFDLWYVTRESPSAPWSAPVHPGAPVNSSHNEFFPSLTLQKHLYFTSDATEGSQGQDDIVVCKWENGAYLPPVSLRGGINSAGYEFNAWVAPDESFLIFSAYNRPGAQGSGDLFISFREGEVWSPAQNLAFLNSPQMDYCPFVDLKNGMIYFTSKRNQTRTEVLHPRTLPELMQEFRRYDNGLSRLYQVHIEGFPQTLRP
ncbi:MAG: hypothetical protein EAZ89_09650 [Bacteroidetes bacterium]|nr:MAG: hypothetical protein EAZ89_09650 [Bacteroidota bacterium]